MTEVAPKGGSGMTIMIGDPAGEAAGRTVIVNDFCEPVGKLAVTLTQPPVVFDAVEIENGDDDSWPFVI